MNGDLFGVDPELADLFPGEPDLLDLGRRVREARPEAPVAQHFEAHLRARLMDAAPRHLRPRRRRLRDLIPARRMGAGLALAGAGLGVAMIGLVVASSFHPGTNQHPVAIMVSSELRPTTYVDPNDASAMRIDFNQAMDHASVQHSIQIQPATAFSTSWSGNTLTIVPTNHLAASTAYVVRLDPRSVRASDPSTRPLDHPVVVAFSTRPAPPAAPRPAPPAPPLPISALGGVDPQTSLDALSNGTVVVGAATLAPPTGSTTPTPAPLPGAAASLTPPAIPQVVPVPTPTSSPGAADQHALARFAPGAPPQALGTVSGNVAIAPDGRSIGSLVTAGDGSASVALIRPDGSHGRTLAVHADPRSPLAWAGQSALVFVGGGHLQSVDLGGTVRDLGGPDGVDPTMVTLAPDGHRALVRQPGAGSRLLDISGAGADPVSLPGKVGSAAFSVGSNHLAWVELGDSPPTLRALTLAPLAAPGTPAPAAAPTPVPATLPAGSDVQNLGDLAINQDGSMIAVAVTRNDQQNELRFVSTVTRAVTGVAPGTLVRPVYAGSRVAAVRRTGSGAEAVLVESGARSAASATAVPAEADALLDRIVSAETGDRSLLGAVPVGGAVPPRLTELVPQGITDGYVVSETRAAADDSVTAQLRLVAASSTASPVSFADETVTLARPAPGQPYVLTAATVSPLAPAPAGPHITHIDLGGQPGARSIRVSFDSDLAAASVAPAMTLTAAGGRAIPVQVSYDAASRTATLSLPPSDPAAQGPVAVTLQVGSGLHDIAGESLVGGDTTTLRV